MNSRQLQYAIMLAENKNFSQVAESLSISQPALSKQIIALETELGVRLFDRSTNPLSLTPAGEFFVERAEALLFEEDVLLKTMERYRTGKAGRLSIGVAPFRSLYLMPPVIQALKERYPELQMTLGEQVRSQLEKGLHDGVYDFIIMNLPVDDSKFNAVPLEKDTLVLAVPNSLLHLISVCPGEEVVELSQCQELPFAVLGQGQEMRQLFERLCRIARIYPNIYVEVMNVTTAWAMVQAGVAATILPKQLLQFGASMDKVTLFKLNQDAYVRQPAVVTRRGQFVSEYAEYAISFLAERYGCDRKSE